jgi:hypothetical protein
VRRSCWTNQSLHRYRKHKPVFPVATTVTLYQLRSFPEWSRRLLWSCPRRL